jgi:hypothetical protein
MANVTMVTWFAPLLVRTINCLGQDTCCAGFASTSRTTEKIGMGYFSTLHGATQSLGYWFLSHYLTKTLWPPLTIENFKPHMISLIILPTIKFLKRFCLLLAWFLSTKGDKKVLIKTT